MPNQLPVMPNLHLSMPKWRTSILCRISVAPCQSTKNTHRIIYRLLTPRVPFNMCKHGSVRRLRIIEDLGTGTPFVVKSGHRDQRTHRNHQERQSNRQRKHDTFQVWQQYEPGNAAYSMRPTSDWKTKEVFVYSYRSDLQTEESGRPLWLVGRIWEQHNWETRVFACY